jgi:hypothetical protein
VRYQEVRDDCSGRDYQYGYDDTDMPPSQDSAVELWDHVVALARFPGFAELKRSLREQPQLAALRVDAGTAGKQEDWHGGSRRQKN